MAKQTGQHRSVPRHGIALFPEMVGSGPFGEEDHPAERRLQRALARRDAEERQRRPWRYRVRRWLRGRR